MWSKELPSLLEFQEKTGITPAALERRPKLLPELQYSMWLYGQLRGSRNPSFGGIAEVPYSEFAFYAMTHGFSMVDIKDLWPELHMIDLITIDILMELRDRKKSSTKK